MEWLLKRGDQVVEGRILKTRTYNSITIKDADTGDWKISPQLYYSDAEVPPQQISDPGVKKLCSVNVSLPYKKLREEPVYQNEGKTFRDIEYTLDMICGGAMLTFRAIYKGEIRSVEANYIENL